MTAQSIRSVKSSPWQLKMPHNPKKKDNHYCQINIIVIVNVGKFT